jgi:hypothetical protein
MNTYHRTHRAKDVWVDAATMTYEIREPLKNHEDFRGVNITDTSLINSIQVISREGSITYIDPTQLDIEICAKKVILQFDSDKISELCRKEIFCKGWYYPSCECCVERFEMTQDEFDPEDEQYKLEEVITRYLVHIPDIRLTVSY